MGADVDALKKKERKKNFETFLDASGFGGKLYQIKNLSSSIPRFFV